MHEIAQKNFAPHEEGGQCTSSHSTEIICTMQETHSRNSFISCSCNVTQWLHSDDAAN